MNTTHQQGQYPEITHAAYDAVLFDLDNTLYDYDSYWRQRLCWSLEPVQAAYPAIDTADLIEQAIAAGVYASKFDAFLQQACIHDSAVRTAACQRYRVNDYSVLRLYADALPMLHLLRHHCKVGLITNGPSRTQRPKIEQFGLEHHMDVVIVSEEVELAKPDPAIFRVALQQLETPSSRALYVGDSLKHDLLGAHAAGIDFVWMNPQRRTLPAAHPVPLAQIRHLRDLPRLLKLDDAAGEPLR